MFIPTTTFLFFILLLLSNTPFPSVFSADGFFFYLFVILGIITKTFVIYGLFNYFIICHVNRK